MDQSMVAVSEPSTTIPLPNVPADRAGAWPDGPLILRVTCEEDIAAVAAFPAERLAWIETTMAFAERFADSDLPLDIVLTSADEAPSLYRISSVFGERLPRVTLAARAGLSRAGAIALALQFQMRIVPLQPTAAEVAEMDAVLDRYLHDPNARTPIEFFHTRLLGALNGGAPTLWDVLERDPDLFPRIDADESYPPQEAGFVERHVGSLRQREAECTRCPFFEGCGGYFKWPDPAYDCADVRRLLTRLDEAATQLQRDMEEAEKQ